MIGLQISGYTITESIGAGGMSDVYKAKNNLGRIVAVKILKKKFSDEEGVSKRFVHEAQVMYKLKDDKGVPGVYDINYIDERPAIVMEFLEGKSFKDLINQNVSISDQDMQKYFIECARILNFAHNHPSHIIHRDIKPSNIYLTSDGQIKIFDFGIAKSLENLTHTETGARLGTLLYMSPEQIDDPKRVDQKTDIYSLGVTFYQMITKKLPFNGDTDTERSIMNKITSEKIDLSSLPPVWQNVLDACMVKSPKDRNELNEILKFFDIIGSKNVKQLEKKDTKPENPPVEKKSNVDTSDETIYEPKADKPGKTDDFPVLLPKLNFKPWLIGAGIGLIILFGGMWLVKKSHKEPSEEATEVVDTTSANKDTTSSIAEESNANQDKLVVVDKKIDKITINDPTPMKEKRLTPAQRAAEEIASTMVRIPGGSFIMGCTEEQGNDCDEDETPAHEKKVSTFYINKFEVTQEQWKAIIGKNPSFNENCDRCPVEEVTWNGVQEFIRKLNGLTGRHYRLPTETEWEYAARGGQDYKYAGSNNLGTVAWCEFYSQPVGQKSANGYGLYDMSGNVCEWCSDWYKGYLGNKRVMDWTGSNKVFRGGPSGPKNDCRVSNRDLTVPDHQFPYIGFRLAASR